MSLSPFFQVVVPLVGEFQFSLGAESGAAAVVHVVITIVAVGLLPRLRAEGALDVDQNLQVVRIAANGEDSRKGEVLFLTPRQSKRIAVDGSQGEPGDPVVVIVLMGTFAIVRLITDDSVFQDKDRQFVVVGFLGIDHQVHGNRALGNGGRELEGSHRRISGFLLLEGS